MKIETVDPGPQTVREAVEEYLRRYPDYADAIKMCGAIMEAQQEALEKIECPMQPLDDTVVEAKLVMGDTLLEPCDVPLDSEVYRDLVAKICQAVSAATVGGLAFCDELAKWDGLSEARLAETRDLLFFGKDIAFEPDKPLSESEKELLKNILWEGLAPFYRACGSMLTVNMEQSWWQRAYCPVCGAAPLMGKFRQGDGLWVAECSLCHTDWNIQRAACPFCNESQGSLDYLYLEEDPTHRVNYCKICKRYVKTVDLRNSEDLALLPLEAIITMQLDLAAEQEGLLPASGRTC